jgi:hypothetical protein
MEWEKTLSLPEAVSNAINTRTQAWTAQSVYSMTALIWQTRRSYSLADGVKTVKPFILQMGMARSVYTRSVTIRSKLSTPVASAMTARSILILRALQPSNPLQENVFQIHAPALKSYYLLVNVKPAKTTSDLTQTGPPALTLTATRPSKSLP